MCKHNNHGKNNTQNRNSENKIFVLRLIFTLIFFALGFLYSPAFYISYLIISYDVIIKSIKNILKGSLFDENFLMTIATIAALSINELQEAVCVIFLYQTGEFLEDKAINKSKFEINKLLKLKPKTANLIKANKIIETECENLKIDDIVLVKAGEIVPTDGVIIFGCADMNFASLSGESIPRFLKKDDKVLSGAINLNGVLKVRVLKEYKDSAAAKILCSMEDALSKKAKEEKFITKFAKIYTPVVVLLAFIAAFIFPLFFDGNWFYRALTFLIISCPCALVISVPLCFFRGIGLASLNGILVKGSEYFDKLINIKNAAFDKTGTLTKGELKIKKAVSFYPDFLKYVSSIEANSNHPAAKAIVNEYTGEYLECYDIKEIPGCGIEGKINGKNIKAGTKEFIGIEIKDETEEHGICIYCSIDNEYTGYIVLTDEIKEEAKHLIDFLRANNTKTMILSGDKKENVLDAAKIINTDENYYELLPNEKLNILNSKKTEGITMYTGDGINDTLCIISADVGIVMGAAGSDEAIDAADIVIMDDNIKKIETLIKISQKTIKRVKENIALIIFVKILFLILASTGNIGIAGAVFADVGLSLICIISAAKIKV